MKECYNRRENQEHCTQVFRKVDKEWFFEERDRGHVICSSGAGTKNQSNQSKIAKQPVSPKCRLCGTKGEIPIITHLVSGCPKLVQKQSKEDMTMLPEELIGNFARSMYEHTSADIKENDEVELYCDLILSRQTWQWHKTDRYYPRKGNNWWKPYIIIIHIYSGLAQKIFRSYSCQIISTGDHW